MGAVLGTHFAAHGIVMDFTALVIFAAFALGIPVSMVAAQRILGPRHRSAVKDEPFECGHSPFEVRRGRMPVKYYQIAMLFIIFDLEIVFLWPWAVVARELGWGGLAVIGFFLGLLTLSFVYAWRKGVLNWES